MRDKKIYGYNALCACNKKFIRSSHESNAKIIQIDDERCDGCGQCIPSCAEGALEIIDGKARVVADKFCDGLGACLGECPNDALHIIEREAEEFDEEAVEEMLAERSKSQEADLACGCPSSNIQNLMPDRKPCDVANTPREMGEKIPSALGHWPIQIRLVPPDAKFLGKRGPAGSGRLLCCGISHAASGFAGWKSRTHGVPEI